MEGSPFIPRASILNRDRTVTNKVLLIIFSILLALWVPIVIYGNIPNQFYTHRPVFQIIIFFFVFQLFAWEISQLYSLMNQDPVLDHLTLRRTCIYPHFRVYYYYRVYLMCNRHVYSYFRFFIVVGYSMLAGSMSILLFVAMRYIPKFSYVIFVTFWCPIVSCTLAAVLKLSFQNVVLMIGSYLSCVFVFYLLHTEWLHLPEGVLKESCR